MKALQDLFTRNPSVARVEQHVERMVANWRDTLEEDAFTARVGELREGLLDGIEQTAEAAGDVEPAAKAEARNAAALLATMRVAVAAVERAALVAT